MLFRRARRPELDDFRNGAVTAWIKTVPMDDRLNGYLEGLPREVRKEAERSARKIRAAADRFLERSLRTAPLDLERFHPALEDHLKPLFPWASAAAIDALKSYTAWYSWHEGYI